MIDVNIIRELRAKRVRAAFMLILSAAGLVASDSNLVFVVLSLNAAVWLVSFWYYTSQIYEHGIVEDQRLHERRR